MNKQTNLRTRTCGTEPANPFLNAVIAAVVALAILPAAIFGAVRCVQSRSDASAIDVEVEEPAPKRLSVAERRAQRLEARKAKEAKEKEFYPEITMETVEPYYDEFDTDYDAEMEFNGFGMTPPAYIGGPGMMPPAYMAGPGMMRVPDRGGFNEFGRPNGNYNFNSGFGRGRGNF